MSDATRKPSLPGQRLCLQSHMTSSGGRLACLHAAWCKYKLHNIPWAASLLGLPLQSPTDLNFDVSTLYAGSVSLVLVASTLCGDKLLGSVQGLCKAYHRSPEPK